MEENMGTKLRNFGLRGVFANLIPKARKRKAKINGAQHKKPPTKQKGS